jgi:hypothetical protein
MVLTLTPALELAACTDASEAEAELALGTTACTDASEAEAELALGTTACAAGGAMVAILKLAVGETVKVGSTELVLA